MQPLLLLFCGVFWFLVFCFLFWLSVLYLLLQFGFYPKCVIGMCEREREDLHT